MSYYDWHTDINVWACFSNKSVKMLAIYIKDAWSNDLNFRKDSKKVFKKVDCHIYFSNNSNKSKAKHKDKAETCRYEQSKRFKIYNGIRYE